MSNLLCNSEVDLTLAPLPADTSFNAELREMQNWGHGHVHVYAGRTRPCAS